MKSGKRLGAFSSSWNIMGAACVVATIVSLGSGEWLIWLPVLAAFSTLWWFRV
jgi:hypothetical protein